MVGYHHMFLILQYFEVYPNLNARVRSSVQGLN